MKTCPICNREERLYFRFCDECMDDMPNINQDGIGDSDVAEWAADRAREFEREKAKGLVDEIERLQKKIAKSKETRPPCQLCVVGDFRAMCSCEEKED
jgi:hypothetical protein